MINKIKKYVYAKISRIEFKYVIIIGFIAFILFLQEISISTYPLIPEDLSIMNTNFTVEPLFDGMYLKQNMNLDVSNLNQLPFQFLTKISNSIGIYGYDVFLIRYLFNFTILGTLIFLYFSDWGKKRVYASLLALTIISTTLIYDQILIYTPRLNVLIIFICIIMWYKKNVVEQNRSLTSNYLLGLIIFLYSFGLFSNVGNSSILVILLCWQLTQFYWQNLLKKPIDKSQKIRLLKVMSVPYLLILPSLFWSIILLRQSKTDFTIAKTLPIFPTYSLDRLIQGRGAWWEEGYLPWFDELQNQIIIEFRYATFLILFLPLILYFLLKCLEIFFGLNNWKIFNLEERREYIILLFLLLTILTLTMYFPSQLMMELNPLFAIYREPWSKFGPVYIVIFGKLLTFTLSIIYKFSLNLVVIKTKNHNTSWILFSLILILLFNSINPKRVPTSSFDSIFNLSVDKNYAKYISKKTLKINHKLNKNSNSKYAYCIVPGKNLHSDIIIGRWFMAFSKNIPHYVEDATIETLGSNTYTQLGKIIENCGKLQIEVESKFDIIHICLPYYGETKLQHNKFKFRIDQNKKSIAYCDYEFKEIPINLNIVN